MFAPRFRAGNVNLSFSPVAARVGFRARIFRGVIEEFFTRSQERTGFGKMSFRKESL